MVSTSGHQLLPAQAVRDLREHLLPIAWIVTPNVPEAMLLLSDAGKAAAEPMNIEDLIDISKAVKSLGPEYVLVKGGHLPFRKDGIVAKTEEEKELMIDILYGRGVVTRIETVYSRSKNTHGTGCSLACECDLLLEAKSDMCSCHRIESCQRARNGPGRETSLPVHRGRYQDFDRSGPREWTDQPFPLNLHTAFCSVSFANSHRYIISLLVAAEIASWSTSLNERTFEHLGKNIPSMHLLLALLMALCLSSRSSTISFKITCFWLVENPTR